MTMNNYKVNSLYESVKTNAYPGRGIVVGKTPDGKNAVSAYFIMGRSENSRNRVFKAAGTDVYTEPFDASKVSDPSLIIYRAVAVYENKLIVTNGDQTDTVLNGIKSGVGFSDILKTRTFEPDSPNFTPRISALSEFSDGDFSYEMSILKSIDPEGSDAARFTFSYPSKPGLGHFIHTYDSDGEPLPTFSGEPERIETENDIDSFTHKLWTSLNAENKISLFVRYVDLSSGETVTRIINKNEEQK